ncbi:MAG: transcription termination/antitermination protein NusA [Collinsella sp.]|nr:transcription termination/antitermination protein NusA [Collinsella sp.]
MAVFLLAPLLALPQKAVPAPAAAPTPTPTAVARAAAPYRAVWVSYLEWEQVDFSSAEVFTQAIGTMLDNIQSIGATVVLAQVRPFGDALYPSDYFPFSHLCTGTQGQDPGFDPLALLVDAAHARDLQLEAWVNPYRIQAGQTPALCGASPARLHPDWVRYTDTGAYLDPASADVRQYIADGVGELCARYAVDGIHFDDYFYPTTDTAFDAADYAASGSTLTQDDWRRENVNALMELCQEKHIDQLYLIDRLEQSLAKSYAEILHLEWGAKVTIDRTTGKIYVYRLEPIDDSMDEEGNFTEFEEIDVTPKNTSRIAAQHAKAEINAIVRNSAREQIYEEFSGRIGDLISGTVLQSTPDFTIVKIREGVEAELPHFDQRRYENERNERPMGERYLHNQHIKAVIIDVRDPNSNLQPVRGEHSRPPIVISRTHPELMRRLFEQEVPEIYEGTVQIKSIAREPGQRSKVAVHSLDDRLDPVGACVGPKGSRVRAVVGELRGERVDVILWDADPAVYVANALSPAKVTRVLIDEEKAYAGVIVPDDQLSLAIGKEGQNARLAARLTGWHIDIKSETLAADILKNVPVHEEPAADLIGDEEDEDVRRCEYVSEDGIQCRNQARPGSRFCGVHDTDAFDDAEDLI